MTLLSLDHHCKGLLSKQGHVLRHGGLGLQHRTWAGVGVGWSERVEAGCNPTWNSRKGLFFPSFHLPAQNPSWSWLAKLILNSSLWRSSSPLTQFWHIIVISSPDTPHISLHCSPTALLSDCKHPALSCPQAHSHTALSASNALFPHLPGPSQAPSCPLSLPSPPQTCLFLLQGFASSILLAVKDYDYCITVPCVFPPANLYPS